MERVVLLFNKLKEIRERLTPEQEKRLTNAMKRSVSSWKLRPRTPRNRRDGLSYRFPDKANYAEDSNITVHLEAAVSKKYILPEELDLICFKAEELIGLLAKIL